MDTQRLRSNLVLIKKCHAEFVSCVFISPGMGFLALQ